MAVKTVAAAAAAIVMCFASSVLGDQVNQSASQSTTSSSDPSADASIQPKQPGSGLIEDTDPAWVWTGMDAYTDPDLHGSSGHAGGPGSYGTYTFRGTAVDVYSVDGPSVTLANRTHRLGKAQVSIDGKSVGLATVDAPDFDYQAEIAHVTNLSPGNHVIQIQAVDGWVVVDYIKVTDTPVDSGGYTGPSTLMEGDYAIYPKHAPDKYVDVQGLADRAQADIYTPAANRNVVWHVTPLGRERYRFSPAGAPGEALTVVAQAQDPNAPQVGQVGLYKYVADPAQQWILSPVGGGYFQLLIAAQPRDVLDVTGSGKGDGSRVIAYPNQGSPNEFFAFTRVR